MKFLWTVLLFLSFTGVVLAQPRRLKVSWELVPPSASSPPAQESWVKNDYGFPITLTLAPEDTRNCECSVPTPYTLTIPAHERVLVAHFRRLNSSQSWSYNPKHRWVWGPLQATHDPSVVYALPFKSGSSFRVVQGFGGQFSHFGELEYAVDFGTPEGTPILASRGGVVVDVEDQYREHGLDRNLGGNHVLVQHDDGTLAHYEHLQPGGVAVAVGTRVAVGDLLGYSGFTGFASAPHLHFMVFKARDGYQMQPFPIRFRVKEGTQGVTPVEGVLYTAP